MTLTKSLVQSGPQLPSYGSSDFLNLISVGLAIQTHSSGLIEFANTAFASLHGYTSAELFGVSGETLIAEEDRVEWRQAVEFAISTGSNFSLEIHRLRKNGSRSLSLAKFTPILGETAGKYLLEIHDREEQNNLTQALLEERELLIASFQQLPVPVLVFTPELRRVLVQNNAFYQMFPTPSKVSADELNKAHEAIRAAVRDPGKGNILSNLRLPGSSTGMTGSIELVPTQVLNSAGQAIALAVVIRLV